MGRRSRVNEKPDPIIHRTKLFQGRMSAEEVHARWGIKQKCYICGKLPVIQIRSLMHHNDFIEKAPQLAAAIAKTNPHGPRVPTFPTTFGPMVLVSKVAACKQHQKMAEVAAAKAPSYYLIEIDRGPGADKTQVQVPGALEIARA